ncbi:MAG: hypothetical protein KAJ10_03690 [Thermodesulfovibrionia bacterium]|nr:hypothetical protein [Thermodesulfovibrionia bacterium]
MKTDDYNNKHKLMARTKRARLQAAALSGQLEPQRWKICNQCGECYPFFNNYLQHPEAKTCPAWLTGTDCGHKYRGKQVAATKGGGNVEDRYYPKRKDCRQSLCNKAPHCANINSCLDLEIANPGTIPLKADGSCKTPVTGIDPKHYRLRGMSYGQGSSTSI